MSKSIQAPVDSSASALSPLRPLKLKRSNTLVKVRKMWILYLFLLIPLTHTFVFCYMPMYGIQIAFKDFIVAKGIWGSAWNNFKHFRNLTIGVSFKKVLWNTIYISLLRMIFGFPAPIIFAVLLNEVRSLKFKRVVQTISYLPHFMSWVVLGGIVKELLSPQRGLINAALGAFGITPIYFITEPSLFRPILILSGIWAGVGWGTIIYLAAMSAIDPQLYEAAEIDGANRFQRAIYVTVPSLIPIIVIQFILSIGAILNAGFDQIFNLYNNKVMSVADIIDTYVYRMGIEQMRYDFSAAVGLFKNVAGVILIVIANKLIKRVSEYGIW